MKKPKIPFILNICLFLLEIAAFIWWGSDNSGASLSSRFLIIRYFSIDSNILLALAALIAAVEECLVMCGKKQDVSVFTYVLKLSATSCATLTLLLMLFYLTPANGPIYGWFSLYKRSNLIFHFLAPVLGMVVFIPYEQSGKIDFHHTFIATAPEFVYIVYYVITTLAHTEGGIIAPDYDWYAFFIFGTKSVYYLVPLFLLGAYVVTYKMWKYNGGKKKKPNKQQA